MHCSRAHSFQQDSIKQPHVTRMCIEIVMMVTKIVYHIQYAVMI